MAAERDSRDDLYQLIDRLAPADLHAARRFLEFLARDEGSDEQVMERIHEMRSDPLYRALSDAPVDDEPTTADDVYRMNEGRLAHQRGESVSLDDLMRERGR